MMKKLSIEGLVAEAESRGCPIWQVILEQETRLRAIDRETIWAKMEQRWQVMKQSLTAGEQPGNSSLSGLVGDEGVLLSKYLTMQRPLSGVGTIRAAGRAMGVAVINASLGKIVAAPTAGSCGILLPFWQLLPRVWAPTKRPWSLLFLPPPGSA